MIIGRLIKPLRNPMLKHKKGNVLVLVVILFLFISILALGILSMSLTESKVVSYDEKHEQAYCLARSVVSATEKWISSNFNDRLSMAEVIPTTSGEDVANITKSSLDGHDYTLRVWRDDRVGRSEERRVG